MLPVVAIVGAPNVGKSTLFNRLTGTRDALVGDEPGVTRDRQYGIASSGVHRFVLIDTGGISEERQSMQTAITRQAELAMEEADVLLFLVDARAGPSATEVALANRLRPRGADVHLVVNKSEGFAPEVAGAEYHEFGLGHPLAISAGHGQGVAQLMATVLAGYEPPPENDEEVAETGVRVAIIGRPNVGKSTLVNRLLGEERMVAHDVPGTTRDSIRVPFERDGERYVLIDTAGVRRRAKVDNKIEKFSAIKTLQSIEAANVVTLIIDGSEGVTDQDLTLLQQINKAGRALVVAVNKWDGLEPYQREKIKRELDLKLGFVDYATHHFISALHGSGVGNVFQSVSKAWQAASVKLATPRLTNLLEEALQRHPPPLVRGRRIKLRYAHQGGSNPPRIIVHGNQTEALPAAYKRYLSRFFREQLGLHGTPVSVEVRTGDNPFKGRRNTLTPRQERSRKRMMKHVKSSKR